MIPITNDDKSKERFLQYTKEKLSSIPEKDVDIITGIAQKRTHHKKRINKKYSKLYGYEVVTEKRKAKVISVKPEDNPSFGLWDGDLIIKL